MGSTTKTASATILEWTEQGRVPDAVVRAGILIALAIAVDQRRAGMDPAAESQRSKELPLLPGMQVAHQVLQSAGELVGIGGTDGNGSRQALQKSRQRLQVLRRYIVN